MDVFLYSGDIERGIDLRFMEFVDKEKSAEDLLLILATPGGSPDAAYKIGRYIQHRYNSIKVMVPGICKSAGTLLAIAADELIFSPYGELGPLDVQMLRTDNIAGADSGLNISEAFLALERRAKETFHDIINDIVGGSGGIVSFQTASHSATEIVSSLYGPIFGRIDPEEVGSRARAMRIGEDYGKRLGSKYGNLKPGALDSLSRTYSSHGFVVDIIEAAALFHRVRESNRNEKALVKTHGNVCRHPGENLRIENLTNQYNAIVGSKPKKGTRNAPKPRKTRATAAAKPKRRARSKLNGGNSTGASST